MEPKEKSIVAIHGAGMYAGVWGVLAAGLSHPCQALSLPGHGRAEGEDFIPSIEEMAEWVGARLRGYTAGSVVLMGHSMGALVVLESARLPAVRALVLMGAAAKMPVHPDLLKQATEKPEAALDMILKWGVSQATPRGIAIQEALRGQMKGISSGALFNDLKACNDYTHGEAVASSIKKPALVIAGTDDKLTKPAEGKALAGLMEQSQFQILQGCGHMMRVEQPSETAEEINRFLAVLAG
jgi:pimeloyl-ACP methyl ester carboxylesterase